MPKQLPTTIAEWERWSEGNSVAWAELENLDAQFHALAAELRYVKKPTEADWPALHLLARLTLDASRRYWGARAETEPDHIILEHKIRAAFKAVEERLGAPPSAGPAVAVPLPAGDTATGPVSTKGWVAIAHEIALQILTDPARRAKLPKKRYLAALAREVEPELRAKGHTLPALTIEKSLRPGVREWERQNPDGCPESRPE